MTDREMLELAAKAAGITLEPFCPDFPSSCFSTNPSRSWNPLADDGDALRLAVKLGIQYRILTMPHNTGIQAYDGTISAVFESFGNDPYAATRRAIVRAAAEIGKKM